MSSQRCESIAAQSKEDIFTKEDLLYSVIAVIIGLTRTHKTAGWRTQSADAAAAVFTMQMR